MECDEGWKATALKTYLLERLRHLSSRQGEHKMQRTMLCTWLTELYLRGFTYLPLDPGTGEKMCYASIRVSGGRTESGSGGGAGAVGRERTVFSVSWVMKYVT